MSFLLVDNNSLIDTDIYFRYRGNEWKFGKPRTPASISADHQARMVDGKDPSKHKHNSVERPCIQLPDVMWDKDG